MNPRPALHPYVLQLSRKLGRLKRQPLPCAVNARRIYVLPTGVGLFFATLVLVMSLGGMLMSDLVRNMWTYSEPAAPVSGLTDWLIEISPFGS